MVRWEESVRRSRERSPRPCRRRKPGRAADDNDAKNGRRREEGKERVAYGEVVRADCAVVDEGDGETYGWEGEN